MKLNFCAVCGLTEDLHHHHFTPKVLGGLDEETNFLTLCSKHHAELHQINYRKNINHSELTKLGLKKAKERGVKLGGTKFNQEKGREINKANAHNFAKKFENILNPMIEKNLSLREIAEELSKMGYITRRGKPNWTPTQVSRMIKYLNKHKD